MLNIVCFKWGNKFSAEYVNKLYHSVSRNITIPHKFICFTEDPTDIECETKPFLKELPTWWYIVGLFNKEHGFKDKVLYMDLDTVITDNIDHIVSLDVPYAITEDFYRKDGLQTTFILWKPELYFWVYDEFLKQVPGANPPPHWIGGTNGFMERYIPRQEVTILQKEFPGDFISYKVHIRDKNKKQWQHIKGDLESAKIICFHGKPMPHEMRELPWMKTHWT